MLRTPPAYIALVDFPLTAQQVRIELKIALFLILVFCAMHLGVVVCKVGKTDGLVLVVTKSNGARDSTRRLVNGG